MASRAALRRSAMADSDPWAGAEETLRESRPAVTQAANHEGKDIFSCAECLQALESGVLDTKTVKWRHDGNLPFNPHDLSVELYCARERLNFRPPQGDAPDDGIVLRPGTACPPHARAWQWALHDTDRCSCQDCAEYRLMPGHGPEPCGDDWRTEVQ